MTRFGQTKVMSARLPADMAEELAFTARIDGKTVSATIRGAVARHIASRKADGKFQAKVTKRLEEDHRVAARLKR